jgi:hypothetical protein
MAAATGNSSLRSRFETPLLATVVAVDTRSSASHGSARIGGKIRPISPMARLLARIGRNQPKQD